MDDARAIGLGGDRLGAISPDGDFYAKDGLTEMWVKVMDEARAIAVSGSRIGAISPVGIFFAKDELTAYVGQADGERLGDLDALRPGPGERRPRPRRLLGGAS